MNLFHGEDGLTLVEVMVAVVILAMVIAGLTVLFSSSYSGIIFAGRESAALYQAQLQAETELAENEHVAADELTIGFDNGNINVPGKYVDISQDYEGSTVDITLFIPRD